MRRSVILFAILLVASLTVGFSPRQQESASKPATAATSEADEKAILQIEEELLESEKSTDPEAVSKLFADDWVNLIPNGNLGTTKSKLLESLQEHIGEAPPYTTSQQQMRIYVFGDTATAIYVKEYVKKSDKTTAHQDVTDIFTRSGETWKLRLTRTSPHQEPKN